MGLKLPSFHPIQNISSAIGGLVKDVVGSASSILNTPAGSALAQGALAKYTGGAAGGGGNAAPSAGLPAAVASGVAANMGGVGKSSGGSNSPSPDGMKVPYPEGWQRWIVMYQLTPDGFYLLDNKGEKQLDWMHIGIVTLVTVGLIWAIKVMFFSKKRSSGSSRRSTGRKSRRR